MTSTTLPHRAPLRDPHPPPATPTPTVYPVLNGCVVLTFSTRHLITHSGCLEAAHPAGRAHPSLAIVDRSALPLRWPDQPALPPRSAPGASLSTLHTRMLSFCGYPSARLISCRACGDDLECCWSVRAFLRCRTCFCVLVWNSACFSLWCCPVLFPSAPFCPVLPCTAQISFLLSRAAGIHVGHVNGGKGGGGAIRARN